jgi:hypothetical protein
MLRRPFRLPKHHDKVKLALSRNLVAVQSESPLLLLACPVFANQ